MRATFALIHLDNLASNLRAIRQRIGPQPAMLLPVKADAYGHGAIQIARHALMHGVSQLAVATVGEGRALRCAGLECPIVLFSSPLPEEVPELQELRLEPFAGSPEAIRDLEAGASPKAQPIKVHLKLDTGMRRIGCPPEQALGLAQRIKDSPRLILGGLFTHFPVSDSPRPEHRDFSLGQIKGFLNCLSGLRRGGLEPWPASAANSGAILSYPDSYCDMVRPGIIAYGYLPDPSCPNPLALKPVMELRSRVMFIKELGAGQGLSYGLSWVSPRPTKIATLPIGYADGYPRLLSGKASVIIRGRAYPQVGRVCMDQLMVDIGPDGQADLYEEAIIFGPGASDAQSWATTLGTIPYEITCNINSRVPRLYVP